MVDPDQRGIPVRFDELSTSKDARAELADAVVAYRPLIEKMGARAGVRGSDCDMVGEVYLKIFRSVVEKDKPPRNGVLTAAYIARVASSVFIDQIRKVQGRHPREGSSRETLVEEPPDYALLDDYKPDAEMLHHWMTRAGLTIREKIGFFRVHVEGLTKRATATSLGISVVTLSTDLQSATMKLQRYLREQAS